MSLVIKYEQFWMRRDTEANWAAANPTLHSGEIGIVTDGATGQPLASKTGDGTTPWLLLPYTTSFFGAGSGTNTITCTFDPKPVLVDGMVVRVRAAGANTGAVTFNPNGLGALAVTKFGGTALAANDIAGAGHELLLEYRSSVPRWELLNPSLSAYLTSAAAAAAYQPLDTQLTDLAALSYSGNALKVVRVNAGGTAFELGAAGAGGLTSYGIADSGGSNVTSFAYQASGGSAFSLNTSRLLIILYKLKNVAGVAVNWRFFCNADTTATNYYSNANITQAGGYSGGNANSARTVDGPSATESSGIIFVTKDYNGLVHFQVFGRDSLGTALRTIFTSMYWTNPSNVDVTDLIVSCTTANGTGTHSTYEVLSP